MNKENRKDLYAEITSAIISELERGVLPWTPQWVSTTPQCCPRRSTGEHYRGINILLLWLETSRRGFESPFWMTYKQASELGAQVRRGEKGTRIVFFTTISKEDEEERDDAEKRNACPVLRTFSVFNACQVERLPERFFPAVERPKAPVFQNTVNNHVEKFFRNAGISIEHGGDRPHYSPIYDRVQMPPFSAFRTAEDYYAILAHEAIHWTGHPSRLPRKFPVRSRGERNYAREELIAELGSAFLCSDLGLCSSPRPDHACYIEGWLDVLRNDKRAIFCAAAQAQKATDFLHSLQNSGSNEIATRKVA